MHVVPITPPWSAQCCDQAGSSNPVTSTGMNSPTCTPGGCPPVSSQSPGTGSPAMMPTGVRSACTCQSRGQSLDNVYPFRPPGALFGPFFPPPPFQCIPSLLLLRLLDFLSRHQGLQCQSNFWGQVRLGCRIVHHSGQKMESQLLLPCNTKMRVSAFTVPRCNRFIQVSCLTTPLICISVDLKPSVFPVSISDFSFLFEQL